MLIGGLWDVNEKNIKNMTIIELDYTDEFDENTKEWKELLRSINDNVIKIINDIEDLF